MTSVFRRLRACALALALLQAVALCGAPLVAACCADGSRSVHTRHAEHAPAAHECCPAGSHPAGQCPMHGPARSTCRMSCAAHGATALPVGHAAVLPPAITISSDPVSEACTRPARNGTPSTDAVPDSPPPRA